MKTLSAGLKTAVFVVVTVAATALLATTISNSDFQPTVGYRALFTDAVNLNPGDEVRLAGVRVGSVSDVRLYHDTQAMVSFRVDRDVPLTTTTFAVIRYRNLIGQRYLALVDGPGNGAVLPKGALIPLSRTQPALNLNALFNGFRPLLSALSPADVNRLSYELVSVLQGEGPTVDNLFASVSSLTNTLAAHDQLIGATIDNLDAVLGPVDARDQQLSALLTNLQRFVSGLAGDRQAIAASLTSINALEGTTASLLAASRPALKADLAQLAVLAEKLDTPKSRALLQHFLAYTPFKMLVETPITSYGSFQNFYLCAANFVLPNGTVTTPFVNQAQRCVNP